MIKDTIVYPYGILGPFEWDPMHHLVLCPNCHKVHPSDVDCNGNMRMTTDPEEGQRQIEEMLEMDPRAPSQQGGLASRFNVGDVVRLKSGGPSMTVTGLEFDPSPDRIDIMYVCSWHNANGDLCNSKFMPDTLARF